MARNRHPEAEGLMALVNKAATQKSNGKSTAKTDADFTKALADSNIPEARALAKLMKR